MDRRVPYVMPLPVRSSSRNRRYEPLPRMTRERSLGRWLALRCRVCATVATTPPAVSYPSGWFRPTRWGGIRCRARSLGADRSGVLAGVVRRARSEVRRGEETDQDHRVVESRAGPHDRAPKPLVAERGQATRRLRLGVERINEVARQRDRGADEVPGHPGREQQQRGRGRGQAIVPRDRIDQHPPEEERRAEEGDMLQIVDELVAHGGLIGPREVPKQEAPIIEEEHGHRVDD